MTLISVEFALFWLVTALLYFAIPLRHRWTVLLGSSLVFYFWNGIGTGYFMLFTVAVVYVTGLLLDKENVAQKAFLKSHPDLTREEKKALKQKVQKKKRLILTVGLVISFAFLVFLCSHI